MKLLLALMLTTSILWSQDPQAAQFPRGLMSDTIYSLNGVMTLFKVGPHGKMFFRAGGLTVLDSVNARNFDGRTLALRDTTSYDAVNITNTKAASAGAQQSSPYLVFTNQAWDPISGMSRTVAWRLRNEAFRSDGPGGGVLTATVAKQGHQELTPFAIDEQGRFYFGTFTGQNFDHTIIMDVPTVSIGWRTVSRKTDLDLSGRLILGPGLVWPDTIRGSVNSSGQTFTFPKDKGDTLATISKSVFKTGSIWNGNAITDNYLAKITGAGKVGGGAITDGTIGGSSIFAGTGGVETTGAITTSNAVSGKSLTSTRGQAILGGGTHSGYIQFYDGAGAGRTTLRTTGTASDKILYLDATQTGTLQLHQTTLSGYGITDGSRWRGYGSKDPLSPQEGDMYYNTTLPAVAVYSNGAWRYCQMIQR